MRIVAKQKSGDGKTTLYTLETHDGKARILTTYVDRPEKHVICFTTTIGCPVACQFCYAGPFSGLIAPGELFHQVYLVHQDQNLTAQTSRRDVDAKPVLFSAMGEGEPLSTPTSFLAVTDALRTMGSVFSRSRLALSTTAMNPAMIRELATQFFPVEFKLQISLISPKDDVRKRLMRTAAPLSEIRGAAAYFEQVSKSPVEWNLVLLDGINDSDEDAYLTARLLGPGAKVKLNGYNAVPGVDLRKSPRELAFASLLGKWGLKTEIYQTDGWDVGAACGQFRASLASEASSSKESSSVK